MSGCSSCISSVRIWANLARLATLTSCSARDDTENSMNAIKSAGGCELAELLLQPPDNPPSSFLSSFPTPFQTSSQSVAGLDGNDGPTSHAAGRPSQPLPRPTESCSCSSVCDRERSILRREDQVSIYERSSEMEWGRVAVDGQSQAELRARYSISVRVHRRGWECCSRRRGGYPVCLHI